MVNANYAIWGVAVVTAAGVIFRPMQIPEAVWALAGALTLVVLGVMPVSAALTGVGRGLDVYLFLTGMMLLAELARQEGVFDWLAARAASMARGSATNLFGLVYVVGILVTMFLSNDATAVVLTPAVAAAARKAEVGRPLPYLFICAFIANAASFVLPISNPANLVIYAHHMPPLVDWLPRFALPSLLSIGVTYVLLRWTQRKALQQALVTDVTPPEISKGGKTAAIGILATAALLTFASASGLDLGVPTFWAGAGTLAVVAWRTRSGPWRYLKDISWSVIALVAGLFILVEALQRTAVIHGLSDYLQEQAVRSAPLTTVGSGVVVALAANLINNLPAGLIAGTAVQGASVSPRIMSAILIGIDLGPNLSVTGSLATILWLTALRRDGIEVNAWDFLKLGLLVMPPALLLALAGLLMTP